MHAALQAAPRTEARYADCITLAERAPPIDPKEARRQAIAARQRQAAGAKEGAEGKDGASDPFNVAGKEEGDKGEGDAAGKEDGAEGAPE